MIFIRYENWKSYLKFYPVTSLILVANIVMFLVLTLNGVRPIPIRCCDSEG